MRHVRSIARIARASDRFALLTSYAKLQLSQPRSPSLILGQEVHFVDHASLRHLFDEIYVNRLYDVNLRSEAPTIVDCGSNIGMAAMYFKRRFPRARVLCFEPHPVLFGKLCKNAKALGIEVHQIALGRTDGSLELFMNDGDVNARSLNFSVHNRGSGTSVTVKCARLSQYMPEVVHLLKLDIEGSEGVVIEELAASGALHRVENIVCEYHHHIGGSTSQLSGMLSLLENAGFVYNLRAYASTPPVASAYQDIMIYATKLGTPRSDQR